MDAQEVKTYRKIYEWARDGERPGGEFDWFAVDRDGFMAAFCTAGFSPVPDVIFEAGWESFLAVVEFIEGLDDVPLHDGGFEPLLQRGLVVFDFDSEETGAYVRKGIPIDPLHVGRVSSSTRRLVDELQFGDVFAGFETLFVEDLWPCR
jgi:hypothetical protein